MKILITGALGNVGSGIIGRLQKAGHELVLYDVNRAPDNDTFRGISFVQGDIQAGVALERAAAGCDAIVHTPAWHGIHWGAKTEADFWRLNVDGTFWAFQAAQAFGIKRMVFLSSTAWYGKYDKYGFTKQICEELCEYNRRNHGIRYVSIRPNDFTPWGDDYCRYGSRMLYGGVDREDVLDCVAQGVEKLVPDLPEGTEAEGIIAHALRPNAFTAEQIAGWDADPLVAIEAIFPGSRVLVEKYGINIKHKPGLSNFGEGEAAIAYAPTRHFGTFIEELRRIDSEGGEAAVRAIRCAY